jgi:hypothetical protein
VTKELGVASRQRTASYFLFHQGNFDPEQHDCRRPSTFQFSLFSLDLVEVDGADSQAVLNGLAELDFQDAFKKMAESLGTARTRGRGLLAGRWWPVGTVSFLPDGSTSPRSSGWFFTMSLNETLTLPLRNSRCHC